MHKLDYKPENIVILHSCDGVDSKQEQIITNYQINKKFKCLSIQ